MPRTTLLLLPGLLCDAALWAHQATALADAARVVVADMGQDDTVEAMARRALAAADGPLAVAGLSMGGYVALAMLRLAPGRVAQVLLMDTSARADSPVQARRRRAQLALLRDPRTAFRGVTRHMLPELLHPDRLGDPALADTVTGMAGRVGQAAFLRQLQAILARPDARAMLPGLRLPVHVAVGEADRLTPPELAWEIAAAVPDARLHVLPGCGHLPPLEDPQAVTNLMRTWMEDRDARV